MMCELMIRASGHLWARLQFQHPGSPSFSSKIFIFNHSEQLCASQKFTRTGKYSVQTVTFIKKYSGLKDLTLSQLGTTIAGFSAGRVRTLPPPPHTHSPGGYPSLLARKIKYIPYFTVISVKIGHFKHQNIKLWNFFLMKEDPQTPPTPFVPPPPLKHFWRKPCIVSYFHPLQVVDRGSETQVQVGENLKW